MLRILGIYFLIGLLYAIIYAFVKKDEDRTQVFLAIVTGWPLFLFAAIGAGWNALLNESRRE